MEQIVAERHFSQEQQVRQPQAWHNGTVHSGGSHFQQDPSQSANSCRWTGWDRTNSPSVTFQPATIYGRTKYDLDIRPYQDGITTSTNLHFGRGSLVREDNYREVRPCHSIHAGSIPFNYIGVNAHRKKWSIREQFGCDRNVASWSRSSERKRSRIASGVGGVQLTSGGCHSNTKEWTNKEQFVCDGNVASGSRSSARKRSRPTRKTGGGRPKREVCVKFTMGKCNKGAKCGYLHSGHEFACSNSRECQTRHLEDTVDLMSINQANQCASAVVTQEHDTFRNGKMEKDVEPPTNTLPSNHADEKTKRLVTSYRTVDLLDANAINRKPVETELTSSCEKYVVSPANTITLVTQKDQMTGVNVDEVNEKNEETKHIEKTYPKRRRVKRRSNSSKLVKSMTEQMTDTSSQRLPMGLVSGTTDVGSSNVDLNHEVNAKPEGTSQILNTAAVVLEKDEMAGVMIDLNHEANKKLDETKCVVKNQSRKRSRKVRSKPSKSVVESMSKEMTDTSSPGLPVSSMEGNSLDHECAVSENDEMAGVNIDLNHEMNEKSKEGKVVAKIRSKKRRRKHECVVSENDEMAGVNIELNHQVNEKAKEGQVVGKNRSRKRKRKQSFEEQGDRVVTMKVQDTVQSLPAVPQEDLLCDIVDNSSLEVSHPPETVILKSQRKLLVLDVNGLLVDIVAGFPKKFKPDFRLSGKGVFKRPFCDDFLKFCFEKFDVGVWSSRTKKNLTRVVDFLWKNTTKKLLFCWDNSHCTETGYSTVENHNKPLVLKELKKLWRRKWGTGFYNESNTILLDDSPYKALRNPPYTAIFPFPYSFYNADDKSLGPDGDLRLYLEKLANAENVQNFIQANPFGQSSITTDDPSWAFYSKISGESAKKRKKIHQRQEGVRTRSSLRTTIVGN